MHIDRKQSCSKAHAVIAVTALLVILAWNSVLADDMQVNPEQNVLIQKEIMKS